MDVYMNESLTFEKFLKAKRLARTIRLREFARPVGLQISHYCSIEAGSLPAQENKLHRIVEALDPSREEKSILFDLAAKTKDDISVDVKKLIKSHAWIPALLRTV